MQVNQQIVFVDSQVADYQALTAGVKPGIKVIVLEANSDGIEQITSVLKEKVYSQVHIVSHGSPGCLYLGNTQLSLDTLDKYQQELQSWFTRSSSRLVSQYHKGIISSSLLLYGCNVATGDAGEEFITKLHDLTGAEIAASTTPIGNAAKGGNWDLDYQTSEFISALAFNPEVQHNYAGILAAADEDPLADDLTEDLTEEIAEDLPSVSTDKEDYAPGSTATITGTDFEPGETIELEVLHNDGTPNTGGGHDPWLVTDGGTGDLDGRVDGNFQTTWYVNPDDSANSAFNLTATSLNSGQIATHHFTDSGADFTIDFAAAAPQIYDHDTGGGAFEDKTINVDAVESLEGGDFAVGEIVSYYFNVNVAPNAVDQFPQAIEVDVSFLVNTTGATGVSHKDIVGVSANYYTGELNAGNVQIISDTGAIDDDSTTASITPGTKIYENKVTGEVYSTYATAAAQQGSVVSATVRLNDLEPGEQVVLRIDTLLSAIPGSTPTGNLQAFITGARVISPTDDPAINVGSQTIPFKLAGEIDGIPELSPSLNVQKVVTTDLSGLTVDYTNNTTSAIDADAYFDSVGKNTVNILESSSSTPTTPTVRYIYKVENNGNGQVDNIFLKDDNGTPTVTTDDLYLFFGDNNQTVRFLTDGITNNELNNELQNTSRGNFQVIGAGFINDNNSSDTILTSLEDLDGMSGNGNNGDNRSLASGKSVYVYYDVAVLPGTYNSTSSTNTATGQGSVNPNGGGQQGTPIIGTDTANIKVLDNSSSSLSGFTYLDLDNDGVKDSNETGITGALITITNGSQTFNTRTDLTGAYLFTGLSAGTYTITQTQFSNYYDGQETLGTFSSGGSGGGGSIDNTTISNTISGVTVNIGNYYQNYNFGELLPADIAGVAYIDLNGDGNHQDTETGRAGIAVTLSGTNDFGQTVNVSATTDSSGRYYFGSLRPSNATGYTINFPTNPGDVGTSDVGQVLGSNVGTRGTDQITNIVLGAGSSGVNYDYGIPTSAVGGIISGTVFQDTGIYSSGAIAGADNGTINDTNANSFSTTPSTGEKRLAGVTLKLYDNNSTLIATTKTDINGNYSFTGLGTGTYRVEETQPQYFDPSANKGQGGFVSYLDGKEASPTGTTTTNDKITNLAIASSTTNLTANNFGELPPASVSGYVFLDNIKNREYGLSAGQSIVGANGTTYSVTTNGSYTNYTIPVRNGEFDNDEFGIAGITLQLTGTNDLGTSVSTTTTTDANGYYRFDGLRPSNSSGYTVTQLQPSAYNDGTYDANSDKTFSSSDVNSGNILGTTEKGTYTDGGTTAGAYQDNFGGINVNFGQSGVDYNFPEATSNGLITGKVYVDADNDGSYDVGEDGISNVTLTLKNSSGTTLGTVSTDAEGDYFFSVAAGTGYTVTETQPGTYNNGTQNSSNVTSAITVTSGTTTANNNFGEVVSSIKGFVKLDTDGNSTTTTNDQSDLSNITIQLLNSGGTVVASTLTKFDGSYNFSNLLAGTYSIQEIDSGTYTDASPATSFSGSGTSSPNSNGTSDRIANITLGTATNLTNYNFYETNFGTISGTVKADTNNDNIGDINLSAVTLELLDNNGNSIDSDLNTTGIQATVTTTNTSGNYSFTNVAPGSYQVKEIDPTGYISVSDGDSTNGNDDTPINTNTNDNLIPVTINAGESDTGNDFVDEPLRTISGAVLADTNNDNTGDSPLPLVTVTLRNSGDTTTIATTTTDTSGNYSFANLAPGNYIVKQTNLAGYQDVSDIDGGNLNSIAVNLNNGNSTGNNFVDKYNTILGTGRSETFAGTTENELFIGGAGQDTLTGNGGNDSFHFNRTSDGIDVITDFDVNGDKLDFRDIFANELSSLSIPANSNPYDAGYVEAITFGTGVMIQVDTDLGNGGDDPLNKDVVLLRNVSVGDINASDFIF
jgi:protocatechuate 3,4-dioxygenase beta subunit